jgi:hypothetical protein
MKNAVVRLGPASPLLAGLLALAACSDQPKVQPTADPSLLSRLDEVEQRMRELEEASDLATNAGTSQGLQAQTTSERLLRVERALDELRRGGAAVKSGEAPATGSEATPTGTETGGETAFQPVPADQPLPEEQIAWYRRLEEEVRRRRAEEQQIERFKRDIARSKAVLTPEQEATVIQLESAYAKKVRELYASRSAADFDRNAMNEKRSALFAEFETQVRAVIPASEADKLITTLQDRNRGFYGATPRVRAGGMGSDGG